jgi:four helix bundle protein
MKQYKNLNIWKNSMELANSVYRIANDLPQKESFGMYSQITRAAVSIPSNIAEGCSRSSAKELKRYMEIALGSAFELETQLLIIESNILKNKHTQETLQQLQILQKQIIAFSHRFINPSNPQTP